MWSAEPALRSLTVYSVVYIFPVPNTPVEEVNL